MNAAAPHPSASPRSSLRNFALIFGDYVLFGSAMSLLGSTTVMPDFVAQFTGSALVIGLVPAIWSGAWLLPQLWAGRRLAPLRYKKPSLVAAGLLGRPVFLLLALALVLGAWQWPALVVGLVLASITVFFSADAFNTVAWFDIIAKVITTKQRGRFFSIAQFVSGVFALGTASFIAVVLGPSGPAFPHNYALLFALASILTLIGLVMLGLIQEPPEGAPPAEADWGAYFVQLRDLLRQGGAFPRVIAARLLTGLAALATPFFIGYATGQLGLSREVVGAYLAAQTLGSMLGGLGLGAVCERAGPAAVIRISVAASLGAPLLALVVPLLGGVPWLWLPYGGVFLLLGLVNGTMMIGWMNYVLAIAPPGQRATYTGLTNTLTGLLAVVVPILGGALLEGSSHPVLFVAAAVGPLAAAFLVARLGKA